jgi:hypothetical protein
LTVLVADDDLADVPGGDLAHAAARAELDAWLAERAQALEWADYWRELCAERTLVLGRDGEPVLNSRGEAREKLRWGWRKAAYIAWSSTPKTKREPKTLEELARLLGLSSAGTIRNWRRKDAGIAERIAELPRQFLAERVPDVMEALGRVASWADPRAHPDRRMFLEMMGEYSPKGLDVRATAEAAAGVDLGRFEDALKRAYGDEDRDAGTE